MGQVYRATDTKLRREVTLKVLPQAVANNRECMARFEHEAQVLAALNHPHIAAIYGLEDSDSTTALVIELVKGSTLAECITQGAIPVDEALPITRQIAEALEYAHERNIIHRDLKPANVKIKPDGTVKVLDFGLAKALAGHPTSTDISSSPTLTAAAIIRHDRAGEPEYEIDDYKVSEGSDLRPYDRQLRAYTSAGRREGLQIIEANIFDLKKGALKRAVDISPTKITQTETEVIGLVERLKSRDFVPSPGGRCGDCDVRQLCKYRK